MDLCINTKEYTKPKIHRCAKESRKNHIAAGKKAELWRKVFMEEMSFEPGVEERTEKW